MTSIDDRRHTAAKTAADTLDTLDVETMLLFDRAGPPMVEYGRALASRGLEPAVVLGQMMQIVSAAWVQYIMPNYALREVDDDDATG